MTIDIEGVIMEKYYFAYGSNMNLRQMQDRCPNASFLAKAKLKGYKVVYDGYSHYRDGAVANIVESLNDFVYGAVFFIDEKDERTLDSYEGYPKSYQKKEFDVEGEDGIIYHVFVYLREPQKIGEPSEDYRKIVRQGAKDIGLPEEYINKYL